MIELKLKITLLSDTTFGRGDGVAGLVDAEVQHDSLGCPFLYGRTVKGMLREECANLVFSLQKATSASARWQAVASALLGEPGSADSGRAALIIGDAMLDAGLRQAIAWQITSEAIWPQEVLDAFTSIRQQTAVDPVSGAPLDETLRASRVILRTTVFWAPVHIDETRLDARNIKPDDALMLLAAIVSGWRRAGAGRNRGRGEIAASLYKRETTGDVECMSTYLEAFAKEVMPS